ncbi:MFS general substrate transporter [Roridomyces roridus]|uniref:MFS general substrate transporter n=1 Tax=Roridomyces roridus TaxID=1738132 RepID=A0AAD7BWK3_9AGAR|nr:MFS general substrate transporter [Roridomyces roridus]
MKPLICLFIGLNVLTAGSVFIFPLFVPALQHVRLTQPQLTSIALAGMASQYPLSPLVGRVLDKYGPWFCSLVASCLHSLALGGFSFAVWRMQDSSTDSAPTQASVYVLVTLFMLAGFGAVFSYFCSLFGAARLFPDYPGASSGVVNAIYGLSPVLLSTVASTWFTDVDGLDLVRFLAALAIVSGSVHLIGAFNLRKIPPPVPSPERDETDETTPLIATDSSAVSRSVLDLTKDPQFWVLFVVLFCSLGPCEMIISNVGSIVLSLPTVYTESSASTQVKTIAISNTITRLLVGPLADLVSPSKNSVSHHDTSVRKHLISRVFFLVAPPCILIWAFFWMETSVKTQADVWVLSVGTGIAYGSIFTLLLLFLLSQRSLSNIYLGPSIIAAVWGQRDAGRNLGIAVYAPFTATIVFSYLYALVVAEHTEGSTISVGESHVGKRPFGYRWELSWSRFLVELACGEVGEAYFRESLE